ncbi:MAG: hypothetical protein V4598_06115 [Bdellovibrionota bacterium]
MKFFLFTALLLFSLPSFASQLVPHHNNLKDISCAILVAVSSFELKQNLLKGTIKKTWGNCMDKMTEWRLWTPVVWTDPDVSPIEVSFREASRRRDFKKGEEIILIQGHGWETFENTPEMRRKLEFIFHKEASLQEAIKRNDQDELAKLLSDETSSEMLLNELTKNKTMTLALAVKTQYLSQKAFSTYFYERYLKSITPPERLAFFKTLTSDKNYKKLDQAPYRLKDMLIYYMTDQENEGWKILMENFDSSVIGENIEKVYFLRNKTEGFDKNWVLKKWIEVCKGPADENVVSFFIGEEWDELSANKKEALFNDMITFFKRDPNNYIFSTLTDNFPSFENDPRFAEAMEFYWSQKKFYDDDTSDSYFFTERVLKAAKKNLTFRPVLVKLNELSKKYKKKYPFQGEIDQLLK